MKNKNNKKDSMFVNILEDLINIKLNKTNKFKVMKKYNISESEFNKIKQKLVKEYKVDPRLLYADKEIPGDMKKYCKEENLSKTVTQVKDEVSIEIRKSMFIKSQSVMQDGEGNTKLVWTKYVNNNEEQQEAVIRAIDEMTQRVPSLGKINLNQAKNANYKNTMVLIPIVDLHFNLKIEKEDTTHGFEWNVDIAEKYFKESMEYILNQAPEAEECVLFDCGDLMHSHDNTSRTMKHGHVLDTDIKYESAMIRLFDLMTNLVEAALKKFNKVYFYSVPGNHNDFISIIIKSILKRQFKDEPRFICDLSKHVNVYYHKFGKAIIGLSHGDEVRPEKANDVLINDNINEISNYKYFDFYFGHIHQNKFQEKSITTIRCLKPLIPNDKWSDNSGFRNRNVGYAQCFVYDKNLGLTSNITYRPVVDNK